MIVGFGTGFAVEAVYGEPLVHTTVGLHVDLSSNVAKIFSKRVGKEIQNAN